MTEFEEDVRSWLPGWVSMLRRLLDAAKELNRQSQLKQYKVHDVKAGPVGFEPTTFGSLHFMGAGARCPILVVLAGIYCGYP